MLRRFSKFCIVLVMEQATQISKNAFIAHVNNVCRRVVVDARYRTVNGVTRLFLIYSDGSEAPFKGLAKAA